MNSNVVIILLALMRIEVDCANILAVYPTPSISHQIVFRKLTLELVKRGHDVTVVTTDPVFTKTDRPSNLVEIDVKNISYATMYSEIQSWTPDDKKFNNVKIFNELFGAVFEAQINHDQVQDLLRRNQHFDLILIEEVARHWFALSHIFKVPVILFTSFSGLTSTYDDMGSPTHPTLYPTVMHHRYYNLTFWEKFSYLHTHYSTLYEVYFNQKRENEIIQKYFGRDTPSIDELIKNVDMVFINTHSIWMDNIPVPPNIIYLGGFHQIESKKLPKDLKNYLDSSKHGVIYVSFGTNALSHFLQKDKIETIARVLGQLPYDVLWKWDEDELPAQTRSIKLSKWFPQADLLKHPKIKLFITQAGLQSTDEAITAGVPLLAHPALGDQWLNAEKYVRHGIGKRILFEDITDDVIRNAIETIIADPSYRENIVKLRERLLDQPLPALERAVFWVEYVIRHKGAKHLRAAGAHITWGQYFEIEILLFMVFVIVTSLTLLLVSVVYMFKFFELKVKSDKLKQN